MPIMIPINVQNVPTIPIFDMVEYMNRVSHYATELWNTMAREEQAKFSRCNYMSDNELETVLANCPSYDSVEHDDMSQLTKEDYYHFANRHKAMKGIEKWM